MSKHFRQLTVKEVIKETNDAVSIVFEIPTDQSTNFKYKAGQYLTIKADIKGESVRRSYSLSSSPSIDTFLKVTSKKVENGKMSHYLYDHVNAGDVMDVMLPDGNFVLETDAIQSNRYVLFAAGSGITPIISILKTALEEEPRSTVHLVYGNRNLENIIFYNELQSLTSKYSDRLSVQHIISQGAIDGGKNNTRITPEIVNAIVSEEQSNTASKVYFICGPEGMIQVTNEALKNAGVDSKTIHIEHFTSSAVDEGKETVYEGDVNEVTAILDGEEHKLILQKGETILEAADRHGIDPPYSCQSGVCTTCKALVTRGEVEMGESFGLDDEEIAEGFVLTCCSRPKTAGVIINYDDI
jgi:ring-1,2-phenylacetyl-CoA epoxidase subunit PaaE